MFSTSFCVRDERLESEAVALASIQDTSPINSYLIMTSFLNLSSERPREEEELPISLGQLPKNISQGSPLKEYLQNHGKVIIMYILS